MNINKFFLEATANGIQESEIRISSNYSLSASVFRGELNNYTISDTWSANASGVINGVTAMASSEKNDSKTPSYLAKEIANSCKFNKNTNASIFKGSEKYHKKNAYNKALEQVSTKEKIDTLFEIEKRIKKLDPRIDEVDSLVYEESRGYHEYANSYGLRLKEKTNGFVIYVSVVAKENEKTKTGCALAFGDDFRTLNIDKFISEAVSDATSKFGAKQVKNGKKHVVFSPKAVASLLDVYLGSLSAEEVMKQSSFFTGKLNEKIANNKITIYEKPLLNNFFRSYFDEQGVAKVNKTVIDKGILKTYFHNLETAKFFGVEPTGNGSNAGVKIGIGFSNIVLKPGRQTEKELIGQVKDGLYIKELEGLHAGMNPQSGHFSLKAEGFAIESGQITHPIELVTIAGNLFDIFKDVIAIGSNVELTASSISTPSILVKNISATN